MRKLTLTPHRTTRWGQLNKRSGEFFSFALNTIDRTEMSELMHQVRTQPKP